MALSKVIKTKKSVEATYWNVSKFTLLKAAKMVSYKMAGYVDKQAYLDGYEPIEEINSYSYELDLNDPHIAYFDTLQIKYDNISGNKKVDVMFSKEIDLAGSFPTDLSALINQLITGCYISILNDDKFSGSEEV